MKGIRRLAGASSGRYGVSGRPGGRGRNVSSVAGEAGELPRTRPAPPIRATVEGEFPEIIPFLGSSRLEEPINWFEATAVFHGHAHNGFPEGSTMRNIPVYNVALAALRKAFPDRPPFRLVEIPRPIP